MATPLADPPNLIRRRLSPLPLHLPLSPNERNTPSLTTQMTFQLGTPLSQLVAHHMGLHLQETPQPLLLTHRSVDMVIPPCPNLAQTMHQLAAPPPPLFPTGQTTPPGAPSALSRRPLPPHLHLYHLHFKALTSLAHRLPPNPSVHSSPPLPLRLHPRPD